MNRTALSFAKSFLAAFFVLGFLVALLPGRAAAQQGCNPPVFSTPILSPAGCPSYLTYFNDWPWDTKSGNTAMAVGDFNKDGKPDVVVALSGGGYAGVGLAVMLGNGDGTFQPPTYLAPCCGPDLRSETWVAVGDFNNDGNLDIAGGTNYGGGGYIYIILGNGDGTFRAPFYLFLNAAAGGAVGDFNGDGKLDLVVTNPTANPATALIYFGQGDGTLNSTPAAVTLPSGDSPNGVVVGDFNHDGKLDFATANNTTYNGSVSVVFGNGDGTFQPAVDYQTVTQNPYNPGSRAVSIVAADFNGDSSLDLATLDRDSGEVSVFLNTGNGTFSGPTYYGGWAGNSGDGPYPQQIAAADFNHDGKMDLVVTASSFYGAGAAVLFGNGDGTFQQPAVSYATDIQLSSVAVGDFNGDGVPDIVASSGPLDTLAVLLNKGDGTFKGARNYPPFVVSNGNFGNGAPDPVSVAFGDLNGDGKADMVVGNNAALNATIFINNGDGTFTESANYRTDPTNNTYGPNGVVVADLRHNGTLDLVAALSSGGSSVSTLLGNGDGTFQTAVVYNPGLGGVSVLAVADVDGDGFPDIVFNGTNTYLGANPYVLYVAHGNGDGTFNAPVATPDICMNPGFGPVISVAVADVTGDGKPDILASCQNNAGTYPANIFLLAGNGDGTFAAPSPIPAGTYPTTISVGDFNGDGIPDLVVGNNYPGGPNFAVLLGSGGGAFQSPVIYSDVNSSFWTNWITSGTPANGTPGPVPYPQAFAIGDFNKDGHLDILVADIAGQIGGGSNGGYWNNGVQLFLGNGDGTFQPEQSYLACWHGQAIAAADLTGSGAPSAAVACPSDLVVTVLINQAQPGVSLKSIAVTPANASIPSGNTQQFTATGTYSDNSTKDLTSSVAWTSTNSTVATINSSGLATASASASGGTTITATLGAVSGNTGLTVTPVLTSISVSPSSASVAAGTTQQFTATGHYSDSSTQNLTASVTWSSSNTSIATIAATGVASGANAGGPITITATQGAVSGNGSLTVTAPALVSIAVTPANPSVPAGNTQQFTATGTYTDGSTPNITGSVTWTSSNSGVATISATGLASAVAGGATTISAKQGAVSGSTSMTVITLQSITIAPLNASVFVGSMVQYTATGHYSDGSVGDVTTKATWTSSKSTIATITLHGGLATGKAKGSTTIKAVVGALSASTTLTVNAVVLQSITVTPASATIPVKGTQQFTATGHYSDGTSKNIAATWTTSAKMVATVSNTGLATAGTKTGTAIISAKSGTATGSATLTVN